MVLDVIGGAPLVTAVIGTPSGINTVLGETEHVGGGSITGYVTSEEWNCRTASYSWWRCPEGGGHRRQI